MIELAPGRGDDDPAPRPLNNPFQERHLVRFQTLSAFAITAQHYASQKERVTLGFAGLLAPAENVTAADFGNKPKPAVIGKGRKARA